ncbi:hypothetical protein TQ38_023295 [Novosphingobium sp. P6W]|nr:hypothetical protein TQ38_023295 [Novosphingobium sp. P6W]
MHEVPSALCRSGAKVSCERPKNVWLSVAKCA